MRTLLLLAAQFALSLPVHAGNAHVHGEARLDVAIDKDTITINLELPMDAAVGFERAPKNDKERATLAATEKAIANPALFVPTPAANCTAQAPKVTMPAFGARPGEEQHADIHASHVFRCATPTALKGIETGIFKHFKGLYRIEARRVGPTGQGAARLTPKSPVLNW